MKIYDTHSQELKDFAPINDNKVSIYVCGPTVYDYPHLGHARCYITWDTVVRYLKFKGFNVTYVRNVTDVDDKIIKKAKDTNSTPQEISKKYYEIFSEAMNDLNISKPDIEPKATENIGEMIKIIKTLIDKNYAYEKDGDVYFRVNRYQDYGTLSKQNIDDLEAGARVEASNIKENPLDFALWKKTENLEEISWDSPWGKGRPGWHIECSAMVNRYLGTPIDIHAGGQDLIFPHHENEKAQAEAAFGGDFVKYWMHNGFVLINEEKMSKSLGNFLTINDMLETYDANTIRFFILTNHYRMPVEFSNEGLKSAKAGIKRLKNAFNDIKSAFGIDKINEATKLIDNLTGEIVSTNHLPFHNIDIIKYPEEKISTETLNKLVKELKNFINAMDEDFNTSKSLAVLFELANCAQREKENKKAEDSVLYTALLIKLSSILGFDLTKQEKAGDEMVSNLMDVIISVRQTARSQKNWEIADKIRVELGKHNIILKDNKDGTTSWNVE